MNLPSVNSRKITKTELAKKLGVSRSALYYQSKREYKDNLLKAQIEQVLITPGKEAYGHKRIALDLKINKKRVLRVMKKFNLKPLRGKGRKPFKKDDIAKPATLIPNLIKDFCPIAPNIVWVKDFTYIPFKNFFVYMASIEDLFTRQLLGYSISLKHDTKLVIEAFNSASINQNLHFPQISHSDQGSEYDANEYKNHLQSFNVQLSMSSKGSPWQNGFKESFFSHFKDEFGDFNRFDTLGELIAELQYRIYLYNNVRIHTALKMPPNQYRKQWEDKHQNSNVLDRELVSKEWGT
jgi:putative transposase